MKFLFIKDKHAEGIYKDVSEQIDVLASNFFEFKSLFYGDDLKLVEKFNPDFLFYLYSTKSDVHRQILSKQKKYRNGCWLLEDKLNETIDVGHFFDYVFTIDKENLEERRKYFYYNIFYLGTENVFNSLKRINYIYNMSNKDRRFKKEVYASDICNDT